VARAALWNNSDSFGTVRSHTRASFADSFDWVMDEARALLHRLERIEALEREGAPPRSVLAEVRALLAEAESWVGAERDGTDLAEQALQRCRDAVDECGLRLTPAKAVPG
jgi:hypothetical protein